MTPQNGRSCAWCRQRFYKAARHVLYFEGGDRKRRYYCSYKCVALWISEAME